VPVILTGGLNTDASVGILSCMLLARLIFILGYCGNSFAAGSVAAPDTDCSFTCPADVCSRRGFLTVSKALFIGHLLTPR
jgi:hypothetical protein